MPKISKRPHHAVVNFFVVLDLIHIDICEFDGHFPHGGNRYFITFIDKFF